MSREIRRLSQEERSEKKSQLSPKRLKTLAGIAAVVIASSFVGEKLLNPDSDQQQSNTSETTEIPDQTTSGDDVKFVDPENPTTWTPDDLDSDPDMEQVELNEVDMQNYADAIVADFENHYNNGTVDNLLVKVKVVFDKLVQDTLVGSGEVSAQNMSEFEKLANITAFQVEGVMRFNTSDHGVSWKWGVAQNNEA